jgi:tetratricopeptide (TPR) repeat protein
MYFERFRAEVARYVEGVHQLGPPASAAEVRGLPTQLGAFLRSWNGAELFVDAVTVFPAAQVARDGERVIFGVTASGDRLALEPNGQVARIEEDTGETLIEGTSFARWIEGFVVAESVLYDREGEFREDVFDETGEELLPEAAEKRERKALKIDPGAPAPAWRLAKSLARLSLEDKARQVLEELVARAPRFAWAWFDLGKLRRAADDLAGAEDAYAKAAEADPEYDHAGYFAAQAARCAAARGDEAAREVHAARALELDPELPRMQKDAAERLLDEERHEEALEAAEVVKALRPGDVQAIELVKRLSARR